MAQHDATQLAREVISLSASGCHRSAELLGSFLFAGIESPDTAGVDVVVAYADALVGLGEHRRALVSYTHALERVERTSRASARGTTAPPPPTSPHSIRMHMAKCYVALGQHRQGVAMLEPIPVRARTLECLLLLARLLQHTGAQRAAVSTYKEALRTNPSALEAVEGLVELGVGVADLKALVPRAPWLHSWIEGRCFGQQHDYERALKAMQSVSEVFPTHPHVWAKIGAFEVELARYDDAMATFERLHRMHDLVVDEMDTYASLLKLRGRVPELDALTNDLLTIGIEKRPEPLLAASLYAEAHGNWKYAMNFVSKALHVDDRYMKAFLMKGALLLTQGEFDEALAAYRTAHSMSKQLAVFQGLIESYLSLSKYKQALLTAREAMQYHPHKGRALSLMGAVLMQSPTGREKARQVFEKAYAQNPNCIDTVLAIAQLNVLDKRYDEAISLLKEHLDQHSKEFMHTKLADVLVLAKNYSEALKHYQTALGHNSRHEPARCGLEHLERILQGEEVEGDESPNSPIGSDAVA